jgi:hypothetical protein
VTRAILLKAWLRGEKLIVVDVPLLIDDGLCKWMGKVVVVVYWCVGLLFFHRRALAHTGNLSSPLVLWNSNFSVS